MANGEQINVWAFRIFAFKPNKPGGWNYTLHFNTLADLVEQLEKEKLQRRIDKLVIVAHGDNAGLVQFDKSLTRDSIEDFASELKKLGTLLSPTGKLLFESCQAGGGEQGSELLMRISKYLAPEQTVVGFIVNGLSPGMAGGLAGDIFEAPNSMSGMRASQFKDAKTRMTEESFYAKWARGGKIVRLPLIEEFSKLKGDWSIVWLKGPGAMSANYSGAVFKVDNDNLRASKKGKQLLMARYQVNLTQRPRTVELAYTAGPCKEKKSTGIVEFDYADFDRVKVALSVPEAQPPKKRPADFDYPPNAKHIAVALRRIIP